MILDKLLSISLITLFLSSISVAYSLEHTTIQLKWKYQFQFAGFIMAKEKGFYKDEYLSVQLKEIKNNLNVLKDLYSRKSDFIVADSSLILEAMKGEPLVAVMAIFQQSPFILLAVESSGIKSLKDIEGKRVTINTSLNSVAISAMLNSRDIKYIKVPSNFNIYNLISGEVNLLSAYISNEPFILKEMGLKSVIFNPKDYGFDFYGDILFTSKNILKQNPKLVEKIYKATKRGWEYAYENIDETVDIIYNKYNTLHKSKQALKYEANILKNISGYGINFGELDESKIKSTSQVFSFIKQNKYNLDNLIDLIYRPNHLHLTQEELKYIQNSTITYGGDPNWLSFELFDSFGGHIAIIEKSINKKFKKLITKDWIETLEYAKENKLDIISGESSNKILNKNYNKIDAYLTNPLVIAMKTNSRFVNELEYLNGKKVAYTKGYGYLDSIRREDYPNINFVECDTPQDGLDGIKSGKYEAFIDTLVTIEYLLNDLGLRDDISVVGKTDFLIKRTLFVNKNNPLLLSIINKVIHSAHKSQWIETNKKDMIDYQLISKIGFVFSIIMLIILTFLYILRRENKRLNNLFNTTIEAIALFENGKLIKVNDRLIEMYGYSSVDEVIGLEAFDFVENSEIEIVKNNLRASSKPYEVTMRKKDGTIFPSLVKGTEIGDNQRITAVIDLTPLKNVQQELEILNRSLEERVFQEVEKNRLKDKHILQHNRLAQMGKMISMIAHQWRQPLNAINNTVLDIQVKLELRSFDIDDKEDMEKFLELVDGHNENILKYIQILSSTIDDFRTFFKPNKEREFVSILKPIEQSLFIVKSSMYTNNIELIKEYHTDGELSIYPNEIMQVILNLLVNSKDNFLDKNIENAFIKIVTKDIDGSLVIEISDNGGGIPDDIIDNIFDPYFSTKSEKNGTGLGLYMSKIMIEEHQNGKLEVFNTDTGVLFRIDLGGEIELD